MVGLDSSDSRRKLPKKSRAETCHLTCPSAVHHLEAGERLIRRTACQLIRPSPSQDVEGERDMPPGPPVETVARKRPQALVDFAVAQLDTGGEAQAEARHRSMLPLGDGPWGRRGGDCAPSARREGRPQVSPRGSCRRRARHPADPPPLGYPLPEPGLPRLSPSSLIREPRRTHRSARSARALPRSIILIWPSRRSRRNRDTGFRDRRSIGRACARLPHGKPCRVCRISVCPPPRAGYP